MMEHSFSVFETLVELLESNAADSRKYCTAIYPLIIQALQRCRLWIL